MNSVHPFWLVLATTFLALIPIVIGFATSYIKISVVLGMIKSALGTQQVPSGLVVMVLSLALSLYVMSPTIEQTAKIAETQKLDVFSKSPSWDTVQQFGVLFQPWKDFMQKHAGKREIRILSSLDDSHQGEVEAQDDSNVVAKKGDSLAMKVLIPAFVISEMKEAFAMAFVILLPFLVIDLVVANILVGLGMYMVSPVMIALPLKLILFVVSDAWILITKGLINSYGM